MKSVGHTIFDSSQSCLPHVQDGSIQYGDGSGASGVVGTDNVVIGGIKIKNQAVELATQMSDSFVSGAGDGLLGLASDTINMVQPKPVPTPVDNMISQTDIPANAELFPAYLTNYHDNDHPFYTFGYKDAATLARCGLLDFQWTPLVKTSGFWQFNSTFACINNTVIARSGNTAIADTGTTLALVDDAVAKKIYAAIPGAYYDYNNQGYVFPTKTPASNLPYVGFAVGYNLFVINKENLFFAETKPGITYGGIQSRGSLSFDILGDTWLKSTYVCFDQGNKRFGCAQRPLTS